MWLHTPNCLWERLFSRSRAKLWTKTPKGVSEHETICEMFYPMAVCANCLYYQKSAGKIWSWIPFKYEAHYGVHFPSRATTMTIHTSATYQWDQWHSVHMQTTSIFTSTTRASLDVCHCIPRGVPHPIRFTSVSRPLLILVDFSENLVHLRSFVSESIFEPIGVRCFDWVIGHRYFPFCHKTVMLGSVSQNIIW